ncbi:MAG: exodeoxyribonuclease VII small subunit [Pirellulales bacterium]|nr:exodeoxyribonuclease VII small subunit [Pirellulales bacterium]
MSENETSQHDNSFEQSLEKLERIVHSLEDGSIDLESALKQYEQGVKLLRDCYRILDRAERKIEVLKAVDDEGQPTVEAMDDDDLSLDEKEKRRSKRRSSGKKKVKRKPAAEEPATDTDVDVPGELF